MSVDKLNDQLINGLVHDLMFAKRYFHLFKQIEKHWSKINFLNKVDKSWILLLKDSAVQQTVLYLSKIYDSSGERNNRSTRCLRDLFKNLTIDKIDDAIKVVSLVPNSWVQFCENHELGLESVGEVNIVNFIERVQNYLDREFPKGDNIENQILVNLKTIRNKKVAHNENYIDEVKLSANHVEQLLAIVESVLDYINTFMSIGVTGVYRDDNYVITQQIENIFKKVS